MQTHKGNIREMANVSYIRLAYHILIQLIGLYGIFYFVNASNYAMFIPVLLIMFMTQFTIYTHYHMSITHGTWKFKYKLFDHFFSIVGILMGMGSPIPWAVIHRLHHKFTDTEDDPHSPTFYGWFLAHFHGWPTPDIMAARVAKKDLMKEFSHLMIYNTPTAIGLTAVAAWLAIFGIFGIEGIFATCIGVGLTNTNLGVTNCWIHRKQEEISKPSLWLWSLILGSPEAYFHKEHHEAPYKYSHTKSYFEWHARLIEILEKTGLVEIKGKKI